ncbi:MAG: PSD1 and planctomycete cytochrome C domain-containing protein, partial [Planctomycetia bacterium]
MPSRNLVAVAICWLVGAGSSLADPPDFSRDVRPILARRCFACHGPDAARREAGLRLDVRDVALAGGDSGEPAIVPGHPDSSGVIARITSTDPDVVMPPPRANAELSEDERRMLVEWIASGAGYAAHWAFVPPRRPEVPQADAAPHAIDAFVRARLRREGLAPAPEADRATLCRRVHLDLVGLPPTPEAIDAFLTDERPDAYERLVDRLLASPRYGERWARRWLDLARYADTNGYEKDRERRIWPWRDWVIRALNADMPYDLFTIRQLAGDMLPDATADDILATGFHRNTMINEEGGIDPLEFRYLAMVDRVGTTGTTWLGLTTACAQCHTHKFDPLTQTEYFGLFAILDNADEPEWVVPDRIRDGQRAAARERLAAAWLDLPSGWPTDTAAGTFAERFAAWEREAAARAVDGRIRRPAAVAATTPNLVVEGDGSILGSGDVTKSEVYHIDFAGGGEPVRAVRLEVLPDERLPGGGPGLCWYEGPKGDFFLSEIEFETDGRRLQVARATESFGGTAAFSGGPSSAAQAIDGEMSSGWSTNGAQGRPHAAVFTFSEPLSAGSALRIVMRFERHYACPLGRFRFAVTDAADAAARGHSAAEEAALREPLPTTLVMRERPAAAARRTRLRHRGEYTQPREEVAPGVPAFLPPLEADAATDRLAFARWLVSAENPLVARVAVNRQWQAFFGRGLVVTAEDFGVQGSPPSHPELLDWLAVAFREDLGWSLKRLHRLIVTSATYRQSSAADAAAIARDPANLLMARGPRVRLEAEVIRDGALAAAGLLSEKMYGPGVRPPQPEGVTEVAYGSPRW